MEAVATIETIPYWTRSRRKTGKIFRPTGACGTGPVYGLENMIWNIETSLFSPVSTAGLEFDSESVQSADFFKQPSDPVEDAKTQPSTPQRQGGVRLHEFVSKTVSFVSVLNEPA